MPASRETGPAAASGTQLASPPAPLTPGPAWYELADTMVRRGAADLVDLYVERRLEVVWNAGDSSWQQTLLQDGAAVRRRDQLVSSDGAGRVVLAELLDLPPRLVPALDMPGFPDPPEPRQTQPSSRDDVTFLRYLWRWCAVVRPGEPSFPQRPGLLDVGLSDGSHSVIVWPRPSPWQPRRPVSPAHATVRPGSLRVLLAPAAVAVLLHELLGHPLESDLQRRGAVAWVPRLGARVCGIPLNVSDDPTPVELPGSFDIDDEGTRSRVRALLQDGVLVGSLGSRREPGSPDNAVGNARRATVHTPPRPRVSNLLSDVTGAPSEPPRRDAQVEVASVSSGSLDPRTGIVTLRVREATLLRRGQGVRALAPFTLVGSGATVCAGLLAAAGPAEGSAEPGWCGKDGEVVPTGSCSPWLLVEGLEAL